MKEQIEKLSKQFEAELTSAQSTKDLDLLKVKYLGRKGPIQSLMSSLRDSDPTERPLLGKIINELKTTIQSQIESHHERLESVELTSKLEGEKLDVTLPGKCRHLGRKHPLTQMLDEVIDILMEMGFTVEYSPEIETEYYNYGGLNYPEDHPARDMQDTFYLDAETLLRSHTTNIQQHIMENATPPIRIISPGKCYRNETITARSHVFFHQVDALYIDENVTFADLLATQEAFYQKLFNEKIEIRVRPSYFPFVEPGMEVDIRCTACAGNGCAICKHTGWLEVCGAGMVHPRVLKEGGINPERYAGYAWGMGIERLFMLRYGVSDIRLFTENDTRFLRQFPSLSK